MCQLKDITVNEIIRIELIGIRKLCDRMLPLCCSLLSTTLPLAERSNDLLTLFQFNAHKI